MKSLWALLCAGHAHDRGNQRKSENGSNRMRSVAAAVALTVALGGPCVLFAQDNPEVGVSGSMQAKRAQVAALYELQGAFHRASSVHDPVNGDSEDVIRQRIRAVLSLWTDNAWILFSIGSPRDGYYIGNGDPANPSTCPAPSANFGNRGTLCTFFKYVAAPFQSANKFVSLAPSYKTEIHVYGTDGTLYFECNFFNVAMDPATGNPLWAATGHLSLDGSTTKVANRWLLSGANVHVVGVPVP